VSSRISDGATLRKTRLFDLVRRIQELHGCTTQEIQGFMLALHGLKFETTTKLLHEAFLAGLIVEEDGKWYLSDKGSLMMFRT